MRPLSILLCSLAALAALRADEMALGKTAVQGVFMGYAKGAFDFQAWDGRSLHEKAIDVRSVTLDEPVRVRLETRSRPTPEAVLFTGYDRGQFRLRREGRDAVERESQVRRLTVDVAAQSFADAMERAGAARAAAGAAPPPERLEDLVADDVVTILHVHDPESVASTRQGQLCRRLAEDSRGRMVYHCVTIPGPGSPLARQYGLTRLPQFRFYSRSGALVTTLTERFAPDDIAAAIDAARRGSKTEARP